VRRARDGLAIATAPPDSNPVTVNPDPLTARCSVDGDWPTARPIVPLPVVGQGRIRLLVEKVDTPDVEADRERDQRDGGQAQTPGEAPPPRAEAQSGIDRIFAAKASHDPRREYDEDRRDTDVDPRCKCRHVALDPRQPTCQRDRGDKREHQLTQQRRPRVRVAISGRRVVGRRVITGFRWHRLTRGVRRVFLSLRLGHCFLVTRSGNARSSRDNTRDGTRDNTRDCTRDSVMDVAGSADSGGTSVECRARERRFGS